MCQLGQLRATSLETYPAGFVNEPVLDCCSQASGCVMEITPIYVHCLLGKRALIGYHISSNEPTLLASEWQMHQGIHKTHCTTCRVADSCKLTKHQLARRLLALLPVTAGCASRDRRLLQAPSPLPILPDTLLDWFADAQGNIADNVRQSSVLHSSIKMALPNEVIA